MVEILAPAGGKDSAVAAINAGADAIYLGLTQFSARSAAENFDVQALSEICAYAHIFGVKIYVALNTLVKSDELPQFFSSVKQAYLAGADAIIMQDMYLGAHIKKYLPEVTLHLSTQAGCFNVYAACLAKKCGFDRVIIARETPLSEIEKITRVIQTEVFIQGALCTCFSGQCYMSSFAGGNSGNRGKCKQPCRKLYSIDRAGFTQPAYRLSLSDLSVGGDIQKLISAGVSSFKIEGRMRRPEYVSAAVAYYKGILSGIPTGQALSDLKRTYNRGNYTKGLAFGQQKGFISSAVQGHIGEYVGVVSVENSRFVCRTAKKFSAGDGFKILRGGREVGGAVCSKPSKDGFILASHERLKNGDKVFVTTDVALNARLLAKKRLHGVSVSAEICCGKPVKVTLNDKTFVFPPPAEARSRPLTAEDIKENFKKVDGLPFAVTFGEIVTDGAFLTAAELNAVRRECYARYKAGFLPERRAEAEIPVPQAEAAAKNRKTAVISRDLRGVNADIGILKLQNLSQEVEPLLQGFSGEKFLFVPPFITSEEVEIYRNLSEKFDGIYCDGYCGAEFAESWNKPLFAGTGMNISNPVSLSLVGAKYVALSKELTSAESARLAVKNAFSLCAGGIKVMDLLYCPFGKDCAACDRREVYTLTDGDGRAFPLHRYEISHCLFEVYNCADIWAEYPAGRLMDCSLLSKSEISNCVSGKQPQGKKTYTRGHSSAPVL